MSKPQFTPLEIWVDRPNSDDLFEPGHYALHLQTTGDPTIQQVEGICRMLEAAPDLYEALEELVEEVDRIGSALSKQGVGMTLTGMKAMAGKKALAKARGETSGGA